MEETQDFIKENIIFITLILTILTGLLIPYFLKPLIEFIKRRKSKIVISIDKENFGHQASAIKYTDDKNVNPSVNKICFWKRIEIINNTYSDILLRKITTTFNNKEVELILNPYEKIEVSSKKITVKNEKKYPIKIKSNNATSMWILIEQEHNDKIGETLFKVLNPNYEKLGVFNFEKFNNIYKKNLEKLKKSTINDYGFYLKSDGLKNTTMSLQKEHIIENKNYVVKWLEMRTQKVKFSLDILLESHLKLKEIQATKEDNYLINFIFNKSTKTEKIEIKNNELWYL